MVLFVTGIGTDVGKSYATGWLARSLMQQGHTVATQKFIQTGNTGRSEDIEIHRQIMGTGRLPEDLNLSTSPIIYSFPASPDLAARLDRRPLDLTLADKATAMLASRYDDVLIEGAGGLMVPLHSADNPLPGTVSGGYLTIDYIRDRKLPVALVTNGQLGSVSHTLLALHATDAYGISLDRVVYNPYFDKDATIAADTRRYLQRYLADHFPDALWQEMPSVL